MSPSLSRLLASAAVLAVAACSTPLRPDIGRLYRVGTGPRDTTPVIVIPGLFGSKLRSRTTGVEVWPGTWSDVLWRPEPATPIRYVLFGGDCTLTPARLALRMKAGDSRCAFTRATSSGRFRGRPTMS